MRKFLLTIVLLAAVCCGAAAEQVYKVAVRAYNGSDRIDELWVEAFDRISGMGFGRFEILPVVSFDRMQELVRDREVDFVYTQPLEFLSLKHKYGVTVLATSMSKHGGQYVNSMSSIIFVRSDRADMMNLVDVEGHILAGIDPLGFGGYLLGIKELEKLELYPDRDYRVEFSGTQVNTVKYVLSGRADAGVVRTGVLETLIRKGVLSWDDVRVLGVRYDGFPLIHSADTAPEWAFAAVRHVDRELVSGLAVALMMDKSYRAGDELRWSPPANYDSLLGMLGYVIGK